MAFNPRALSLIYCVIKLAFFAMYPSAWVSLFVCLGLLCLYPLLQATAATPPRALYRQHASMAQSNIGQRQHQQKEQRNRNAIVVSGGADAGQAKSLSGLQLCLAGALATAIGDFAMHPVDTVKVVQQASGKRVGVFKAIKEIWKTQGIKGFYQGVVPYLISDGSSGAIKFAAFETLKKYIEDRTPKEWHRAMYFVSAAGAFVACSFVLVPGEVIKCRMQAAATSESVSGIISSIWAKDGLKGFFAGYGATLLRDVPYTMLELGLYENLKVLLKGGDITSELSQGEELFAAGITGAVAASLTTPLDLVKTKLMMQSTSGGGQYSGVFDVFKSLYETQGVGGLFAGMTARVTWLLPFTVIYLGVYESSKRYMSSESS